MRNLKILGLTAILMMVAGTSAFAEGDCNPPPSGGGIVGGLGRVTRQIDGVGCNDQGKSGASSPTSDKPKENECKSLVLAYAPATAILYRETSYPRLTYAPDGCSPPAGAPEYKLSTGRAEIFLLGDSGWVSVISNTSAAATVSVSHGALSTTADVSSLSRPEKCKEMRLTYEPATVALDQSATPTIALLPQNCLDAPPTSRARFDTFEGKIVSVSSLDGTLTGVSEGEAYITARLVGFSAGAKVTVVNSGPDCKGIEAVYERRMPLGAVTATSDSRNGVSPTLSYKPAPCKRPPGAPEFSAITSDLIRVAPVSGVVTALKLGKAQVGVKHQDLTNTATIEIIPIPDCNALSLSYRSDSVFATDYGSTPKILVSEGAAPQLRYSNVALGSEFDTQCTKPSGKPQFEAPSNYAGKGNGAAIDLSPDGGIKGVAAGSATVRVKHATLESMAIATVVERCTGFSVRANPDKIDVGKDATVIFSFVPADCPMEPPSPDNRWIIGGSAGIETDFSPSTYQYVITGLRGGSWEFHVSAPHSFDTGSRASGQVTVAAPPCEQISLTYSSDEIRPKGSDKYYSYSIPRLSYAPEACTRPPGNPSYSWDEYTGNFSVDTKTGMVMVRSVAESKTFDHVTVQVTHGSLADTATVRLGK